MASKVWCKKVALADLTRLTLDVSLPATRENMEFNILGMGHELWVAVEGDVIVGFTVVGRSEESKRTIIQLQVASSHANRGIGTSMVQAILDNRPESEVTVVPFQGTEEFYRRLGFERLNKWEMRFRRDTQNK